MRETLKMMKGILTGKEGTKEENQLIDEYQRSLSPNILAYFFVNNFGLINNVCKSYPKLDESDTASFCLQELDNCLQRFDKSQNIQFMKYYIIFLKYRLNNEIKRLSWNNRKSINDYYDLDDLLDIGMYDNIQDYDLILNEYFLNDEEKKQCKLLIAGYSIKEISELLNLSINHLYYNNVKIKQKILELI